MCASTIKLHAVRADITRLSVDAIVNAQPKTRFNQVLFCCFAPATLAGYEERLAEISGRAE